MTKSNIQNYIFEGKRSNDLYLKHLLKFYVKNSFHSLLFHVMIAFRYRTLLLFPLNYRCDI